MKERLDVLLVSNGYAESREKAPREAGQKDGYLYLSKTAW